MFKFHKSSRLAVILSRASLVLALCMACSTAGAADSPPGAKVYFISPQNGDTVQNPVVVRFGLKGMGVAPSGIEMVNTGHHHLIVDAPTPDLTVTIPTDDHHLHFGGGQTETEITLTPGTHTLQLVLGDYLHVPHAAPVVSEQITITVKD